MLPTRAPSPITPGRRLLCCNAALARATGSERRRPGAALALAAALLLASAPAAAQSDPNREAAAALGDRGVELYQKREWSEALSLFQRAYSIVQAPSFLLYQARCLERLERFDEADAAYARVEAYAGDETLSATSRQAVAEAQVEHRALQERHPRQDRRAPPPERPPAPPPPPPAEPGSSRTASWVAFGIGGSGLILGLASGAVMLTKKSTLDARCPDHQCGPEQASTLQSFRTARTLSWVGWGVGVAGVAAGIGFRILDAPRSEPQKPSARLVVGPTFTGIQGAF